MVLKVVYKNRKNTETIIEDFIKKYFWDEGFSCYKRYPVTSDEILSKEKYVYLDGDGCVDVKNTFINLMKPLGIDFQVTFIDVEKTCSYDLSLLIISWYENGKFYTKNYQLEDF